MVDATRDEIHKSCEKVLEMHDDEEDPPSNFSEEERPTKASRPAEDFQHSKWAQYSDYDGIAQAIYQEDGISGSLKSALISMAK